VVVYVDSAVADSNVGRVGMSKFNVVKDALHRYHDMPVKIVAIHHHTVPIPMAGRERNVLSNAGDLLDLFLRFDVDLVLSGHRHYPNVHRVDGTVFVNAGTVSCRKTRYGDVNSFNVIDIDEQNITIQTHRLNDTFTTSQFPRRRKHIFHDFGRKIMCIAQMANTYISRSDKFLPVNFNNAVRLINQLAPDVIVHCGGIVEEGTERCYELAGKYISRLEPPIVYTPAGRDMNYLGYHLYPRYFGDMDQSYVGDGVFLQGVSSAQYDSPIGIIGATERNTIFENLDQREEAFKGIFLHHNVVPIPHARERGLLEDAGDLLRAVVDHNLDIVLTGTSSHPHAVKVGDTVIVNANTVSGVYQRSVYGHSFNVIDVYEKVIVVSEFNSLWGNRRTIGMWER
jgi:predicted phosphodiesterase